MYIFLLRELPISLLLGFSIPKGFLDSEPKSNLERVWCVNLDHRVLTLVWSLHL